MNPGKDTKNEKRVKGTKEAMGTRRREVLEKWHEESKSNVPGETRPMRLKKET